MKQNVLEVSFALLDPRARENQAFRRYYVSFLLDLDLEETYTSRREEEGIVLRGRHSKIVLSKQEDLKFFFVDYSSRMAKEWIFVFPQKQGGALQMIKSEAFLLQDQFYHVWEVEQKRNGKMVVLDYQAMWIDAKTLSSEAFQKDEIYRASFVENMRKMPGVTTHKRK